jgi:putative MATE family efflux protein
MSHQLPPGSPAPIVSPLISGPILPTLARLALANALAMAFSALVAVFETAYVGRLGAAPLAGIALVFPFAMMSQTMSAGAMGGGVSSAISRAMGAGDRERAADLAWHAALIGLCGGLMFLLLMEVFGRGLFALLGGRGAVLDEAAIFSHVLFTGSISIWMVNTLASVLRGTGDMRTPSMTLIVIAVIQVAVGGALGLGLLGLPKLGMAGVASGQVVSATIGMLYLGWYLLSGRSRLPLAWSVFKFRRAMFNDILRVGAVSSIASLQTVLTILIFTGGLAGFGNATLAGYGIGARLEFMLIPIAFAVGVAAVPMIGMAIGAGLVQRARRVAWTSAAVSGVVVGLIGIWIAIWPEIWIAVFTSDPMITREAANYFSHAGPAYGFFGVGLTLYFASQGAAKVWGPVLAGTLRLVAVAVGVWWILRIDAGASAMFTLVAAAMVIYGATTAFAVKITPWVSRA